MDLCIYGAHLKVGYKRVIEIWDCEHKVLPMTSLFSFEGDVNTKLFLEVEHGSIIGAVRYQHRRFLLPDLFYDMYYLEERVYEWELGPDRRRVPYDVPYYMLSIRSIRLEQDIAATKRVSSSEASMQGEVLSPGSWTRLSLSTSRSTNLFSSRSPGGPENIHFIFDGK
ncbi:hypothetical protein JCGZ_12840 [Jatropha curcas]|uniref:Uncharacterized protein n=1 Tax=Jatropha curcas TaxID=180498 RepID=A0A067KDJ1_JATCU|nr:hypothetical protein JCGZ_12840 [Jatropha curcas]